MSEADVKAVLEDGADFGQVVNARSGMYTAQAYGQQVLATRAGTVRGIAARRMEAQGGSYRRTPRLMPESIYQVAQGDREQALRLLRRFGYLL
jgi:hypothetical protein